MEFHLQSWRLIYVYYLQTEKWSRAMIRASGVVRLVWYWEFDGGGWDRSALCVLQVDRGVGGLFMCHRYTDGDGVERGNNAVYGVDLVQ